ncbi:unnamed protein product [Prorocentrum cordatum]|uniref:Uncharacterized protein n=1 Tax=Prorocentrum cordatum TaxID=2364126 RepID=A0ABN9WIL5_9DINO|nr:unnamed protein product [Polarella glacialis]
MLRLRKTHEKIEGWVRQQLVSIRAGEEGARRRRGEEEEEEEEGKGQEEEKEEEEEEKVEQLWQKVQTLACLSVTKPNMRHIQCASRPQARCCNRALMNSI